MIMSLNVRINRKPVHCWKKTINKMSFWYRLGKRCFFLFPKDHHKLNLVSSPWFLFLLPVDCGSDKILNLFHQTPSTQNSNWWYFYGALADCVTVKRKSQRLNDKYLHDIYNKFSFPHKSITHPNIQDFISNYMTISK